MVMVISVDAPPRCARWHRWDRPVRADRGRFRDGPPYKTPADRLRSTADWSSRCCSRIGLHRTESEETRQAPIGAAKPVGELLRVHAAPARERAALRANTPRGSRGVQRGARALNS